MSVFTDIRDAVKDVVTAPFKVASDAIDFGKDIVQGKNFFESTGKVSAKALHSATYGQTPNVDNFFKIGNRNEKFREAFEKASPYTLGFSGRISKQYSALDKINQNAARFSDYRDYFSGHAINGGIIGAGVGAGLLGGASAASAGAVGTYALSEGDYKKSITSLYDAFGTQIPESTKEWTDLLAKGIKESDKKGASSVEKLSESTKIINTGGLSYGLKKDLSPYILGVGVLALALHFVRRER